MAGASGSGSLVVLYADSWHHERRARSVIPEDSAVLVIRNWDHVPTAIANARVILAVISEPEGRGMSALRRIVPMSAKHRIPIVLVANPDVAKCLRSAESDLIVVVELNELETRLWPAVHRIDYQDRAVRPSLGDWLAASRLPGTLCEALEFACRSEAPVKSVTMLARLTGHSRSTIGRQWRQVVGVGANGRLEHFLGWLLVLRAVEKKQAGRSWERAADELGLYRSSLARVARRITGCTLRDLDRDRDLAPRAFLSLPLIAVLRKGDSA